MGYAPENCTWNPKNKGLVQMLFLFKAGWFSGSSRWFFWRKFPKIPQRISLQKRHPRYPTSTHPSTVDPPSLEALAQAQSVGLRKAFSALLWQAPQKLVPWLVGWLVGRSVGRWVGWLVGWLVVVVVAALKNLVNNIIIEFDRFVDFKD